MLYPNDFQLCEQDSNYQEILHESFLIMSEHYSRHEISKRIQAMTSFVDRRPSIAEVSLIISDVELMYGSIINKNKAFRREMLIQKHIALAKRANLNEDLEEERKNYEAIAKLDDLHNHDDDAFDWKTLQLEPPVFSSDPKILTKNIEEAQTIDE
ncbi:MAG: hypothetical protein ABIV51_12460 [Saprospiraceae bacterium]